MRLENCRARSRPDEYGCASNTCYYREVDQQKVYPKSIDLLPKVPEEQVKKVQRKGKVNVFALTAIFLVVSTLLLIFLLKLLLQFDYNKKEQKLVDVKNEIISLQYVELKQKTLDSKIDAYVTVRDLDFSPDVVLTYLRDVAKDLSEVNTLNLDSNLEFQLNGKTDSYINAARLWHDMSQESDYFEYVTLDSVGMSRDENNQQYVSFSFSGKMIRENVGNLE